MKKLTVAILFSVFMLFTTALAANVYINDKQVAYTEETGYPITDNGTVLTPIGVTMDAFGAEVTFDEMAAYLLFTKENVVVRCRLGANFIYRNNVKIPLDIAPTMYKFKTYIPIKPIFEAFGATVETNGTDVRVYTSEDDGFIDIVEHTPSVTRNYWAVWNQALAYKEAGNYQQAIDAILSISSEFIRVNSSASHAMLYTHLGDCYSKLGNYSLAKVCYEKEAEYWSITPGMSECVIDANRRAKLISTTTRLYAKTASESLSGKTYFGEVHEPRNSVYLGAYAEGDTGIYNPYVSSMFYMNTYPELIGRDVKGYILYLPYGEYVSHYATHIKKAIVKDKILQIALEPHGGMWQVNDSDGYLVALAKEMERYDCKFMLRFAGEMNDVTSTWYTSNPEEYIEKFRIVANIFHKYAPSVPLIWSPNFYPEDTIDDYYPGDPYVDYVGMSSYMQYQPVTDPMEEGVDRSRWSTQPNKLYSLYGHKKPIIISEGGASYTDRTTGADITDHAVKQIEDFYTYLPIMYPNIKMAFLFDADSSTRNFRLSGNSRYLEAYKKAISTTDIYSIYDKNRHESYYELGNTVPVYACLTELCAHITTPKNNIAYVVYYIDGVRLGVTYGIPYRINADLTNYRGRSVAITVKAFDASDKMISNYTTNVWVDV